VFVLENPQVEASCARAAGWLRAQGLTRGDRVAIVASNRPGYVALAVGALRVGIMPVPVNVHLAGAERDRIVADAQAALVVDDDRWPDWSDAAPADLADVPLGRPMHYTSGTTGLAKGVWAGVLDSDDARALVADEAELWDARPGDTYLVCSPLYHSAPLRVCTSALLAGARVIVFEHFDADAVTEAFVDERITGAFLVPTHLRRLLALDGFAAPHARRIIHAGEPCPPVLKERAIDVFGAENLVEFYGSTEGQFTMCASAEWLDHRGSVGRARTGRTLAIDGPDAAGIGTIWVTAPRFARFEYWNDPVKTASAWRGDAFSVGDLGRLDVDGYLYIEGRREDLIISGGVNVYPAEVERILLEHPDVVEAAVFGVPDDEFGQRVCAAVTGAHDTEAVRTFARDRLPGSHAPKQVFAVDQLPRTNTGKVRRGDLRELAG
jgi:acyl-CoA synthetase (AMP-forming)/AMP-acid ligase II